VSIFSNKMILVLNMVARIKGNLYNYIISNLYHIRHNYCWISNNLNHTIERICLFIVNQLSMLDILLTKLYKFNKVISRPNISHFIDKTHYYNLYKSLMKCIGYTQMDKPCTLLLCSHINQLGTREPDHY
jgi:hypothetical protein